MATPAITTLALSLAALQWSKLVIGVFFVFCFGATCGSFINVIVYRLPLGQSIVRPPSACPSCKTRLAWRDNFPILGWLWLRGRCRYCRTPISPEYPLVELFVALLFALTFTLWFADAYTLSKVGLDPSSWRPEWAQEGFGRVLPIALLFAALFFALVAVTLIDAKTFHIPLVIPWMLAGFALAVHPIAAAWIGPLHRSPHQWVIPVVGWPLLVASMGGALGLLIANAMLRWGLIPRSFADYEDWEREHAPSAIPPAPTPHDEGNSILRAIFFAGPIIAGMFAGLAIGMRNGRAGVTIAFGAGLGMLIGLLLRRLVPEGEPDENTPVWIHYPHARREMLKESLFLLFPAALAVIGYTTATTTAPAAPPPPWLAAFGGSLFGLMIGGGAIWAIRIIGSLAFGKEAMGLGDVHLMASVGAVLGWIDPTIAFFVAPFSGIAWTIGAMLVAALRRDKTGALAALPYGPHLAAATVLVVLARPVFEALLSAIFRHTVNLP
ncbi:MAG: A24 family peptidase [Phycisphaeraceae bacterium]|nr:A24 family peptidase [Phycisphaeraceae bacterium]